MIRRRLKLPPPVRLTREQELNLFRRAREGDIEARDALICGAARDAAWIVRKIPDSLDIDDSEMEIVARLCERWHEFDPSQGKRFGTFALMVMRGARIGLVRKCTNRQIYTVNVGLPFWKEIIDGRNDPCEVPLERLELLAKVKKSIARLKPREQAVLRLYFGLDGSSKVTNYREIGRRMKCTKQWVGRLLSSAIDRLRKSIT